MQHATTDRSDPYLHRLVQAHRRLNKRIDTSKAAGLQQQLKTLKRLRLQLKDEIFALQGNRRTMVSA